MRVGFGSCVLDAETRELRRDGRPIHLAPLAFRLLELLLENRPRALSKAQLLDSLWPGTFVTEASLSSLVADLRAAIGDSARGSTLIRTVQRHGYAFAGDVRILPVAEAGARARTHYRLMWRKREVALERGETILGRAADATFVIDDVSVSRRHVRVIIDDSGAKVEDLGSKNGTAVNGRTISSGPVSLADGDSLRVGSVLITFRICPSSSTETGMPEAH